MKTVYECETCGRLFISAEDCAWHEENHKRESACISLELCVLDDKSYGFSNKRFRTVKSDLFDMVTQVSTMDKFPRFRTECLDNPDDILAAKNRLIFAANEWLEHYDNKILTLAEQLQPSGKNST